MQHTSSTDSSSASMNEQELRRVALRLWPGVAIVVVQWVVRFILPYLTIDLLPVGIIGGLVGGLLLGVWWLFLSRAAWIERIGALLILAVGTYTSFKLVDVSVATAMQGMMYPIYAVPILSLAFVIWAVLTRHKPDPFRRISMGLTLLLASAPLILVRTGGFSTDMDQDFAWRWSPTAEERLLTQASDLPSPAAATAELLQTDASWPGFRGPNRDSIAHSDIDSNWASTPPKEIWRRAIGPAWSSFAVQGDLFYTQEQRGEQEAVSCYRVHDGQPVWRHEDKARFWESNAGAGPRGTPTLHEGKVISLGATGILNVLDAASGQLVWTRDAAADTKVETPYWGFSNSPIVVGDLVITALGGRLAAYDWNTGATRWQGPDDGTGYSSPQVATIDGTLQVLQLSAKGIISVTPGDGTLLWEHPWEGYPIVQPALVEGGDVLISVANSSGIRRLHIDKNEDGWKPKEVWTTRDLKPYFNDFVIHKDHVYGFDGNKLACINLKDGKRNWKGGNYGDGQFVMLADQDLMLVLSEKGDLALVSAKPDRYLEVARMPAIKGITWNHPVLVGDTLLIRNSKEMVAYKLARLPQRG